MAKVKVDDAIGPRYSAWLDEVFPGKSGEGRRKKFTKNISKLVSVFSPSSGADLASPEFAAKVKEYDDTERANGWYKTSLNTWTAYYKELTGSVPKGTKKAEVQERDARREAKKADGKGKSKANKNSTATKTKHEAGKKRGRETQSKPSTSSTPAQWKPASKKDLERLSEWTKRHFHWVFRSDSTPPPLPCSMVPVYHIAPGAGTVAGRLYWDGAVFTSSQFAPLVTSLPS
eukprot:Sspe_Gene.88638::Locus_60594_Transcript_1_1_Confidence_1.000_Length_771::g.88638::m.88638